MTSIRVANGEEILNMDLEIVMKNISVFKKKNPKNLNFFYKGYKCEIKYGRNCFLGYIHKSGVTNPTEIDNYENKVNNNTYIPSCGFTYFNYGLGFDDDENDITILHGKQDTFGEEPIDTVKLNIHNLNNTIAIYGVDKNRTFKTENYVRNEIQKIVNSFC